MSLIPFSASSPFLSHALRRYRPLLFLLLLAAGRWSACATTVYTFEDLPEVYFFSSGDQNTGTFYSDITFGSDFTCLNVSRFGGYDSSGLSPESEDVAIRDASDAMKDTKTQTSVRVVVQEQKHKKLLQTEPWGDAKANKAESSELAEEIKAAIGCSSAVA